MTWRALSIWLYLLDQQSLESIDHKTQTHGILTAMAGGLSRTSTRPTIYLLLLHRASVCAFTLNA
jgi:hypothetical protein